MKVISASGYEFVTGPLSAHADAAADEDGSAVNVAFERRIGGFWSGQAATQRGRQTFRDIDPATGGLVALVEEAARDDVDAAVQAAKRRSKGRGVHRASTTGRSFSTGLPTKSRSVSTNSSRPRSSIPVSRSRWRLTSTSREEPRTFVLSPIS